MSSSFQSAAQSEPQPRGAAVSLRRLKQLKLEDELQLLGSLILARSIGMIFGQRGSGKSFLAMLISYAVAARKHLSPWGEGKGAVICYLDGEMRIRGFRDRLNQLDAFNSDDASRAGVAGSFYVVSRDLAGSPIGSIDTDEGQDAIDAQLPPDVKFIVIDNLSAWTSGGAEDVKSWQSIKTWLIAKRLKGIAVLILHHAGKGGAQRGTSAHEDLLDYSMQVSPHHLPDEPEKTAFTVEHTKLRDHLPELKTVHLFTIWTEGEALKFNVSALTTRSEALRDRILELLESGLNQTQIAGELKVHKSTVSRVVKEHLQSKPKAPAADR